MRRDVPEPWATWLIDAGMTSPNARRQIPSARRLAERVGSHTTTLMNMMHGVADTDPATVAAVAEALGVDVVKVSRQVGQSRTERSPWVPPFEANLLSRRQQLALSELIRAMAAEEREDDAEQSAPTKAAGSAPAKDARVNSRRARALTSPDPAPTPTPAGELPHQDRP